MRLLQLDPDDQWETFMQWFLKEFASKDDGSRAERLWMGVKQKVDESVANYWARYDALVGEVESRKRGSKDKAEWERRRLDVFLNGLLPGIRAFVIGFRPKTAREAMEHATEVEVLQKGQDEEERSRLPPRRWSVPWPGWSSWWGSSRHSGVSSHRRKRVRA